MMRFLTALGLTATLSIALLSVSVDARGASLNLGNLEGFVHSEPLAQPGVLEVIPANTVCNPGSKLSQCVSGFKCTPGIRGPEHFCTVDSNDYPPTCAADTKLKLNDQCGAGASGGYDGACCPSGLVCATKDKEVDDSSDWVCSVSPLSFPPQLAEIQDTQATDFSRRGRRAGTAGTAGGTGRRLYQDMGLGGGGFRSSSLGAEWPDLQEFVRRDLELLEKRRAKEGRGLSAGARSLAQAAADNYTTDGFLTTQSKRDFYNTLQSKTIKYGATSVSVCRNFWYDPLFKDAAGNNQVCDCFYERKDCFCNPYKGVGYSRVPRPITIDGNKFVDNLGNTVQLKGLNWFGFNTGKRFLEGLYLGEYGKMNCMAVDLSLIIQRLAFLGINAVRLPMRFSELEKPLNGNTEDDKLEKECIMPTIDTFKTLTFDDALTKLNFKATSFALPRSFEGWKCTRPETFTYSSTANYYLPNYRGTSGGKDVWSNPAVPSMTVLNRYLQIIQMFNAHGIYTIVEWHGVSGLDSGLTDIFTDAALFKQKWINFMNAVTALPSWQDGKLKGTLLIDIFNEPDVLQCRWSQRGSPPSGQGSCAPYKELVYAAISGIRSVYPGQNIMFEGLKANADAVAPNPDRCQSWGDGFRTDITSLNATNGTALDLFTNLTTDTAMSGAQLVLSPHLYCYGSEGWGCSTTDMGNYFDVSWKHKSVPISSSTRVFPVVIGETGDGYDPYSANATEVAYTRQNNDFDFKRPACQAYLSQYLKAPLPVTYPFTGTPPFPWDTTSAPWKPAGLLLWSYSFNTGTTGGLVWYGDWFGPRPAPPPQYTINSTLQAGEGINIKWHKWRWMRDTIGMTPWWQQAPNSATTG